MSTAASEDELRHIYARITPRQAEVLDGLADFRKLRDIAEDLCLSFYTVRGYVRDLKALIGVHSVRELGRWWLKHRVSWERCHTA